MLDVLHIRKNNVTGNFELVYADKLIEVFRGSLMRRAIARGESDGQYAIVNAVFQIWSDVRWHDRLLSIKHK